MRPKYRIVAKSYHGVVSYYVEKPVRWTLGLIWYRAALILSGDVAQAELWIKNDCARDPADTIVSTWDSHGNRLDRGRT